MSLFDFADAAIFFSILAMGLSVVGYSVIRLAHTH